MGVNSSLEKKSVSKKSSVDSLNIESGYIVAEDGIMGGLRLLYGKGTT